MTIYILWLLYAFMLALWIGASTILSFHWRSYAHGDTKTKRAATVYYVGSIILLCSAGLMVLSI